MSERRSPWALATPIAQAPTQTAYGFTGHSIDVAQGITNMGGRLYDQRLARFLSPDPIAHPKGQALNRYSYVRNSPAMLTDPSGFDPPTNVDIENETPIVGEYHRRAVTSTNTTQWEAGDVGQSSDEFRTMDLLGVPIKYRPFQSELRAWGDYFMLRDRRIMFGDDAAREAKPWFAINLLPSNLLLPDERGLWDMAKSAKENFQAGLAAGATGKGAWHFTLALGASALLAATFIPGESAEAQALSEAARGGGFRLFHGTDLNTAKSLLSTTTSDRLTARADETGSGRG